ncbi:MAG: aldose 1-epimerase family protein [Verrucomicrobiota bacterium]
MMSAKIKKTLVSPESKSPFHSGELSASTFQGNGADTNWSVKSYVLQGGLQEGVQVVEVNNGKFSYSILPTRGMGIWKGQCGDVTLGWDSPVADPVNPAFINEQDRGGLGWLKGFNEWFVRCGINSMGAPGIDTVKDYSGNEFEVPLTLHGKIANIPARFVELEITEKAIIVRGEVDETMMFGPCLRLNTEIRTEFGSGAMTISDTVTNLGNNPQEHEMLYHINYGATLLEEGARLVAPFHQVAPRDPRSTEGIDTYDEYGAPEVGFVEQAYLFKLAGKPDTGETMAMLRNAAGNQASLLRFTLADFPCFTLWKNTSGEADGYVTGMEPATNYPNARRFEREKGRVIELAGGESRTTTIRIETLETIQTVAEAEAEIKILQATARGEVLPQPDSELSS